jgi:hypothetical protein
MHYNFHKNKRVLLIFKGGRQEVARWRICEGKLFYFMDHEPVRIDKLRAISLYRDRGSVRQGASR